MANVWRLVEADHIPEDGLHATREGFHYSALLGADICSKAELTDIFFLPIIPS